MRTRRPVALAATCFLLVVSLLGACADQEPDAPDSDGTQSASPSPSPSASPSDSASPSGEDETPSATTALTTRGMAQGPPPAVAYLAADDPAAAAGTWSLVRPGGQRLRLPEPGPRTFALMGNGVVLLGGDGDGSAVSVVDGNGEEVRREQARGYHLAVTPDRSIVAWLGEDGRTTVLEGGGGRTFDLSPVEQADEIAAILGQGTCQEGESETGGCTAFLNAGQTSEAYLTSSHGITDLAGSMRSISDAAPDGRLIGLVSVTDQGSCSGVYVEPRKPVWQTCDHTLTRFSPDATRILGTDAYLDGFGQRTVAFLDTDGAVLHEFRSTGRGATVLQTAWEDEDHVLAVLYERGRWSVARLGVDGSAELALGPVEASDLDLPYALEVD